jgi:hypothetical protein
MACQIEGRYCHVRPIWKPNSKCRQSLNSVDHREDEQAIRGPTISAPLFYLFVEHFSLLWFFGLFDWYDFLGVCLSYRSRQVVVHCSMQFPNPDSLSSLISSTVCSLESTKVLVPCLFYLPSSNHVQWSSHGVQLYLLHQYFLSTLFLKACAVLHLHSFYFFQFYS